MTGSNHLVTGALIAAAVPVPWVALPLAFVSHFVLDALPHFGDTNKHSWLNRHFKYVLGVDALIMTVFLLALVILQPLHWVLILIAALVAVSPDVLWIPYYLADQRGVERPESRVAKLFKWIQWGERPWGIYVEAVWLVVFTGLLIGVTT